MVGRKTSPRCANCRKRKIKCDLAKPSCSQCLKSKWPCPGYETHTRFYAYNKQVSEQNGIETHSNSGTGHTTPSTEISRRSRSSSIATFPLSAADSLRNEFIFKITFDAVSARMMVISENQILRLIPVRIGSNQALDQAVRCVCSTGDHPQATSLVKSSRLSSPQLYAKALQSLQQALLDPLEATTAETMGAATLLQMHEHSTRHSKLGWVAHANGVIKMLELRGPSRITTDLDMAIFRAQVGNIFIHALRNSKKCFLAEPEWHDLLLAGTGVHSTQQDIAFGAMIDFGVFIPGIVCQYEEYKAQVETMSNENLRNLVQELAPVQKKAEVWQLHYSSGVSGISATTHSDAQVARLTHASKLSLNIFVMLVEFMIVDLHSSGLETELISEFGAFSIPDEQLPAANVNRFRDLVSEAKLELCMLNETDVLAASNTAWLMGALLSRTLAASHNDSRLQCLREPMDDLLSEMKFSLEPVKELSHFHGQQVD